MPAQNKTKALTPTESFKGTLVKMKDQFASILPKHIPVEKFLQVVNVAVALRPEILSADRRGLFGELMKCAQDGLVPDGREATINCYGSSAKYLPMVYGICKKARNSGLIQTIDSQVVYEKDDYEAWIDERGQHFKFVRARGDGGKVRLTFSYAITKDEGFFFEEIDEEQMAAIERSSKAKTGPWKGPFKDEMRRKSAIRRLAKYRLPSSSDLDTVFKRDDDLYDLNNKPDADKPEPPKDTPSRLKNIIDSDPPEPAVDPAEPGADRSVTQDPPAKPKEEPPI